MSSSTPSTTEHMPTPDQDQRATEALTAVRHHYPEAISTDTAVHALLDVLAQECGLPAERILLADSICSDDVNAFEYPERARAMLGPFRLGGLDGFPHAGLTGMAAFAAHVPDSGGIVIYHAPHIGVSRDRALGVIRRPGQQTASGCCGAARAALAKLQQGALVKSPPAELDYQQGVIEQLVLASAERILAAAEPLKETTEVLYEAITERIDALVTRTTFPARWLVRFGGILVNGDADMGSYSVARRIVLTDLSAGTTRDIAPLVAERYARLA